MRFWRIFYNFEQPAAYTQQGQIQMVQPATHQPQMQVYGPAAQPQSAYAQQNSIQQQSYQGPVYYHQQVGALFILKGVFF